MKREFKHLSNAHSEKTIKDAFATIRQHFSYSEFDDSASRETNQRNSSDSNVFNSASQGEVEGHQLSAETIKSSNSLNPFEENSNVASRTPARELATGHKKLSDSLSMESFPEMQTSLEPSESVSTTCKSSPKINMDNNEGFVQETILDSDGSIQSIHSENDIMSQCTALTESYDATDSYTSNIPSTTDAAKKMVAL